MQAPGRCSGQAHLVGAGEPRVPFLSLCCLGWCYHCVPNKRAVKANLQRGTTILGQRPWPHADAAGWGHVSNRHPNSSRRGMQCSKY